MKNSKGFTLIELLAVVVILAVIALISTPIIMNIIENAQEGAFKNTAYGIVQAGKYSYTNEIIQSSDIKSMTFSYIDGVEISNPIGKKLDYKGTRPKSGTLLINSEGQTAMAIYNGKVCAEKTYGEPDVTITDRTEAECLATLSSDSSSAEAPVISGDMIPIKWDGATWVKASIDNIPGAVEWYNYSNQQWANVALVTSTSRDAYKDAALGTEILEADVQAYLVWIPRYKYKLFNVSTTAAVVAQQIDAVFEDKTTPKSAGTTIGTYLTHPAFTFGTTELSGIWVGKFETTGVAATPTIKPNVSSLRSQTAYVQYTTAKLFNTTTTYGLSAANDAHMMKNTEWGAIAYLSKSIYGKSTEVWVNPNTSFKTGCAGGSVSEASSTVCNTYGTMNGQQASTTGNVYGVYDMSGGAYDMVMGVMYNTGNATIMVASSGFPQATIDDPNNAKYVDKYLYATSYSDYSRRILGDATSETRAWNGDYGRAVYSTSSNGWTRRGYVITTTTASFGPFAYGYNAGAGGTDTSFRVAIIAE